MSEKKKAPDAVSEALESYNNDTNILEKHSFKDGAQLLVERNRRKFFLWVPVTGCEARHLLGAGSDIDIARRVLDHYLCLNVLKANDWEDFINYKRILKTIVTEVK